MSYENGTTMLVTPAGSGGGLGGFGGDGFGVLVLFFLMAMLGGGWGGYGNGGGCGGGDVQRGFDHSSTITKLDGITTGIADATYALNNTMTSGFNALMAQGASCCCETQRQIERGFCDVKETINNGNRSILDFLTTDKINSLTAENVALKGQISQSNQNAYFDATLEAKLAELLRRVSPTPVPAYTVPAPYPYGYGYNFGAGCGCGCNG